MIKELKHNGRHYTAFSVAELLAAGVPADVVRVAEQAQIDSELRESRRVAYVAESDPLFLEWQYDQTVAAEQAWRDKVAEIKARYPLPGE